MHPTLSEYIQLATLVVITIYTIVTYKLLSGQNKQGFENKFFQLLQLHHQIVNGMKKHHLEKIIEGRQNFLKFYEQFTGLYKSHSIIKSDALPSEIIQLAYTDFYNGSQILIGHYFRNLYNIIKFIDQSDIVDKKFYTNLLRAQLSSHELLVLFYNCLSSLGNKKLKPLVEKYNFLQNMPTKELIDVKHKELYKDIAFANSI